MMSYEIMRDYYCFVTSLNGSREYPIGLIIVIRVGVHVDLVRIARYGG